jgi:glycosyltransferase involved in cell wall biosynthesis
MAETNEGLYAEWEAQFAAREAALKAQLEYWQAKSSELAARAAASEQEAAQLRRLTSDLLRSYSWKITAPLRALARPFFRASPQDEAPSPPGPAAAKLPMAELRRARSVVVIPSAVGFQSSFNQRPISMARYFADRGSTVMFVALQSREPVQEVYPRIYHLPAAAFQASLEEIASLGGAYLCTLPNRNLLENARTLRAGGYHIHYDIMDDWEEFHGSGEAPWYTAAVEREMVQLSDTVSAVSGKLAEKFRPLRKDIAVIPNGYDPGILNCPQFEAAHAPLERKTVGYFGHLSDAWFDWETVLEAARRLREVEFELIGYGLSDRSRARLADYPNIRFQGLAAQSDLHRFARRWWAGMIPFRESVLAAAVDPLKIYEYLHFGLPTVVTGVSGIAGYPLVRFAADREAFVTALDEVRGRPDEHMLEGVSEFLKTCLWKERLADLNMLTKAVA